MFSWIFTYVKAVKLYTLNMCGLLYFNNSSIKLLFEKMAAGFQ